jgi:hypothetical protein
VNTRLVIAALLVPPLSLAAPKKDDAKKEVPKGPPSKAVTNEIVDAVAEEMNRGLTLGSTLNGAPQPFHISYKITEEIDGVAALNLPLEATPRIAKRASWLVTDAAYKEALLQLRAKLDARRAGGARAADIPGWTPEKPLVSEDPVLVPELEKLDELETRAKAISATFRDLGHIRDSRVAVTSYLERRWYLTTEGTSVTDTRRASGVLIAASGQAEDGQPISD